jgi:hypothetical protein
VLLKELTKQSLVRARIALGERADSTGIAPCFNAPARGSG